MKLSVIVSNYNNGEFLKKCIDSILEQSFKDYELIIIDDGSTDNSNLILREYQGKDTRIKIIYEKHKGVSHARNKGIEISNGEYITFIDSDDTIDRKAYEICMKKLAEFPADLVIFSILYINENKKNKINFKNLPDNYYDSKENFICDLIKNRGMSIYSNCNKIYKRTFIKKEKIYFKEDYHFGEDRLFNYEYLKYANRIITISNKLYSYYLRDRESASSHFIPSLINILIFLHQEKIEWISKNIGKNILKSEFERFKKNDIINEIFYALRHYYDHFSNLDEKSKKSEFECILVADYPEYFWKFKYYKIKTLILVLILKSKSIYSIKLFYCILVIYKKVFNRK